MWFAVLNILILAFVLRWIRGLKECECARAPDRTYMEFYFMAALAFQFSVLLEKDEGLHFPMAVLACVYGLVALNYIQREKACVCAGRVLTPQFFWITLGQTLFAFFKIFNMY